MKRKHLLILVIAAGLYALWAHQQKRKQASAATLNPFDPLSWKW